MMIGRTWKSKLGSRRVVAVEDNRVFIKTDGMAGLIILPARDLDAEVARDEQNVAGAERNQAVISAATEVARQKKAKAEDTDGFADRFSPMQRARTIQVLCHEIIVNGILASRRDHVRRLILQGYRVASTGAKRILRQPDTGTFFDSRAFGIVALDYAEWLSQLFDNK